MEGWLKLHRAIVDSAVFEDAEVLKIWIWLLCNVAHEEHDTIYYGKIIHLKKGQIVSGRKKIAQLTNMSESKVYRALNLLKKMGNIDIKVNNRFSLITVVKWAFFQADNKKVNSKTTAKQQQNDSKTTAKQQQDNTTKECKELKECIEWKECQEEAYPPTLAQIKKYCSENGINIDAEKFYYRYSATGWMVGKSKIKDWRAMLRLWETNEYGKNNPQQFESSSFDIDEFYSSALKRAQTKL